MLKFVSGFFSNTSQDVSRRKPFSSGPPNAAPEARMARSYSSSRLDSDSLGAVGQQGQSLRRTFSLGTLDNPQSSQLRGSFNERRRPTVLLELQQRPSFNFKKAAKNLNKIKNEDARADRFVALAEFAKGKPEEVKTLIANAPQFTYRQNFIAETARCLRQQVDDLAKRDEPIPPSDAIKRYTTLLYRNPEIPDSRTMLDERRSLWQNITAQAEKLVGIRNEQDLSSIENAYRAANSTLERRPKGIDIDSEITNKVQEIKTIFPTTLNNPKAAALRVKLLADLVSLLPGVQDPSSRLSTFEKIRIASGEMVQKHELDVAPLPPLHVNNPLHKNRSSYLSSLALEQQGWERMYDGSINFDVKRMVALELYPLLSTRHASLRRLFNNAVSEVDQNKVVEMQEHLKTIQRKVASELEID